MLEFECTTPTSPQDHSQISFDVVGDAIDQDAAILCAPIEDTIAHQAPGASDQDQRFGATLDTWAKWDEPPQVVDCGNYAPDAVARGCNAVQTAW